MEASNLTISIDAPCNQKCPFCISKMTFAPASDRDVFYRNIDKARKMAEAAHVSSVLITSKGEPTLSLNDVFRVLFVFDEFPVELQTNGKKLSEPIIRDLADKKLNTVAFSVYRREDIAKLQDKFMYCLNAGLIVRLTIVLTDLFKDYDLYSLLNACIAHGIKQLTIRKATRPIVTNPDQESGRIASWISKNTKFNHKQLFKELESYHVKANILRKLPWGAIIYDIAGIAVTVIDYCIQESNNSNDIRSLIYHQDGHMYTSWDKQSSIIF